MEEVRPIFKKLLLVVIVLYIAGTAYMIGDLYMKVEKLNHRLMHIPVKH